MQKDLTDYRKSYEKGQLLELDIPQNPLELFKNWFKLADESDLVEEANAMSLSTVDEQMLPKTRIVLLKSFSPEGFRFYSNYNSEKGRALDSNPNCCVSFFWPGLEKQIIIQAKVSKLSYEESEKYFHSRPKGSQLGALVSNQSSVIPSREYLEEKLKELEVKYDNRVVPLPDHWGGYLLKPFKYEFWQGRKNRLHDRILYTLTEDQWKFERLAP
ncbi:pyridoxamine 5'-phosphate oxidase [Christiangramia salexigens]|uniref:Pyridoxine/pyridoxamine 5'-phosphate oxidase n=1 Tax=Christiangramia salexigens TaxID=1913577 RepID=A0A1L3J2Q7_9FLAO|nr:pyridoxamine 5'-phosphate oxidase [Christiangramia salexigens]APG59412.1 pyridoxamine 5'-phosphate oxidase [Christiangramia salexigens]